MVEDLSNKFVREADRWRLGAEAADLLYTCLTAFLVVHNIVGKENIYYI